MRKYRFLQIWPTVLCISDVIPPQASIGERGFPGLLPRNSALVFDLELITFSWVSVGTAGPHKGGGGAAGLAPYVWHPDGAWSLGRGGGLIIRKTD